MFKYLTIKYVKKNFQIIFGIFNINIYKYSQTIKVNINLKSNYISFDNLKNKQYCKLK